jgi:hypothetical protein
MCRSLTASSSAAVTVASPTTDTGIGAALT